MQDDFGTPSYLEAVGWGTCGQLHTRARGRNFFVKKAKNGVHSVPRLEAVVNEVSTEVSHGVPNCLGCRF